MKRVFVAIDLPLAVKDALREYCSGLKKRVGQNCRVKWVQLANMHITLHFAGSVDAQELDRLTQIVAKTAEETQAHTIILEKTGAFTKRKARSNVLWIGAASVLLEGVHYNYDLWGVAESVACTIQEKQGHVRRYNPHITLARLKDPESCRSLIDAHLSNQFGPIDFEVNEFVIYESTLTPEGSVYSALSKHELKG